MPNTSKPKRVSRSITLPEQMDARLQRECDARLLNASVLIEKAVSMLFTSFDVAPAEHTGS